ncbi:hypothetical protein THRCLA_20220 [Thraustotheca clavata]|uniref:BRCT domain-containing protein n=1 Tax=Thraustotheca clavata TaxID=74557 RepID=A0A1W0A9X6_9STRA|nr:hypothetical protein THRCLA_20220 [Thraustotheca clavata]
METETAVGGDQETPSQWRHGGTQEAIQDRVETLVLCSFDEDETQIRFLSNCLSQEECGPQTLQERKLLHVQSFNGDEGDGDDEDSGNESEDMWVGGTNLLAQWSTDVQKAQERESQVLADLPQWNSSAMLQDHSTSSDVDTNVSEDEDMATQTNSAMFDSYASPQSIGSSISTKTQAISLEENVEKIQDSAIVNKKAQENAIAMQKVQNDVNTSEMDQDTLMTMEKPQDNSSEMEQDIAPPPTKKRKKTPASEETKPKTKAKRTARATYCESEDFNESQPRVSKRTQKINESESMSQASSLSFTQDVITTIRVVLTGIEPTPSILRKVKSIKGAVFEEDVTKGTHLVAPENQLKRTVKMLCGISCCLHILDEKWLHTSSKMRRPANEYDFCLNDTEKQMQWGFELKDTMYKHSVESRQVFLQAYSFYITPHKSIRPPAADLEKIILCGGGQVLKSPSIDSIVISSPEAMATKTILKKVGSKRPVYSPELILLGVLKQSLDLETHRLAL